MSIGLKIEFNSAGFKEVLCGAGVQNAVQEIANGIQARANAAIPGESEGFSAKTWMGGYGGGRWVASVTAQDYAASAAESEYKVLSRAVR